MSNERIRQSNLATLSIQIKSDLAIIGGLETNLSRRRRTRFDNFRESLDPCPEPGLFCVVCHTQGHEQTECPVNPVVYDDAEGIPLPLTTEESRYLARPLDRFAIPRAVTHRLVASSLAIQRLYSSGEERHSNRVGNPFPDAYKYAIKLAVVELRQSPRHPTTQDISNLDHGVLLILQQYYSSIFTPSLLEFASAVATEFARLDGSNA
jgi:hypothetical protein